MKCIAIIHLSLVLLLPSTSFSQRDTIAVLTKKNKSKQRFLTLENDILLIKGGEAVQGKLLSLNDSICYLEVDDKAYRFKLSELDKLKLINKPFWRSVGKGCNHIGQMGIGLSLESSLSQLLLLAKGGEVLSIWDTTPIAAGSIGIMLLGMRLQAKSFNLKQKWSLSSYN